MRHAMSIKRVIQNKNRPGHVSSKYEFIHELGILLVIRYNSCKNSVKINNFISIVTVIIYDFAVAIIYFSKLD